MEKHYKVLSIDIWDTIIRRKCHPDEIKAMTAEYLCIKYGDKMNIENQSILDLVDIRIQCEKDLGRLSQQQGKDDEYELYDVFREWLKRVFSGEISIEEAVIQDLYQYELEKELDNAFLDSGIIEFIEKYNYDSLIIISDFYANSTFIQKILDVIHFPLPISRIFVSCESGYNKRSSNLFKYVLKELMLSPAEQLHIGDNANSDVYIPQTLGISSVHYLPEEEHKKRICREQAFSKERKDSVLKYKDFPFPENDISIFFTGFAGWIAEKCMRAGIKKLYFFTREGEFYKQIFDLWVEKSRYKYALPKTYILEVSRVATFLPSLREVTTHEMMRIWNQYSCQSMAAFFKSLRLSADTGKMFTKRYGIDFDEVLTYPWQLESVQALFNDMDFVNWIQQEIDESKSLFIEYCTEKDLTACNAERIGIVDIGWRGTIQDNLCYIFPNYTIDGFYIGLVQFLNQQPDNAHKFGYISFYPKSVSLFHTLTPFEMICNSPNGSTIEYQRIGDSVKAIRRKEESEDSIFYSFTKGYQEAIIEKMNTLLSWNLIHYVLPEQYHKDAFQSLYLFCFYPDIECANAYFSLVHNEEFGVGEYVDKRTHLRLLLMISAVFSKKKRTEFKNFLLQTTWPQGYLKKYHLTPLLKIYNRIVEKYDMQGL